MSVRLTTANCIVSENEPYICLQCGKKYRGSNSVALCMWGSIEAEAIRAHRPKATAQRRKRTLSEQISLIKSFCNYCEHQLKEPTDTLDRGVCLLRVQGCGSCKTIDKFFVYLESGRGCPAKPSKFPPTELIDQTEPAKEQSG